MILIGLTGLPGSGKDTLADVLCHSEDWERMSFADPIKNGLSEMFNIPVSYMGQNPIKNDSNFKFGKSIRYMLQTLGTEFGRDLIDENVWCNIGEENINRLHDKFDSPIVVTDLRFQNEFDMIKRLGGVTINIIRSDNPSQALVNGAKDHASNHGLDLSQIDHTIYNNGTLEEFESQVVGLVNNILKRGRVWQQQTI